MTAIGKRVTAAVAIALVAASGVWSDAPARGQAVAYQPQVSSILNGAALSATPVVSADRRYVRMTLTPYFNAVNGFTTYSSPLAAVSGAGPVGLGGGGAAGGAGGGAGLGGAGGFAGMNGPIVGTGMGGPMMSPTGFAATGTYLAGDYPFPAAGMAMGAEGAMNPAIWPGAPASAVGDGPFGFADAPDRPVARQKRTTSRRKPPARKPSRRPTATKRPQ